MTNQDNATAADPAAEWTSDRRYRHLLRCAIAFLLPGRMHKVAGQTRAEVAHQLQVMLADVETYVTGPLPLAPGERESFEAAYVADAHRAGFTNMTVEEVAALREGDHYGDHRVMLNGKWEGWQWCAATRSHPGADAAAAADLWYLQDTRQFVGNDVLWWAKDGKGYTTDLSKAHVFGAEEAERQVAARGVDRAWPKAYVDAKARPAVDFQHINHDAAIAAQSPAARGKQA